MNVLAREPNLGPAMSSTAMAGAGEELGFLHAPRQGGWPLLILRWGRFEAEVDGPFCGFLRMGKVESYARFEEESGWFWQREAGTTEVSLGRYRVTVSRQPEA
ncbi:hypothetical protein ACFOD4_03395 [Pseudoroseomonas globiformis]|uniref:Uncharacterized protein n=1 Tax=Teichococcus globiformis TaxID=2307229 RepID=A0ABV7FWR5_9PROT